MFLVNVTMFWNNVSTILEQCLTNETLRNRFLFHIKLVSEVFYSGARAEEGYEVRAGDTPNFGPIRPRKGDILNSNTPVPDVFFEPKTLQDFFQYDFKSLSLRICSPSYRY